MEQPRICLPLASPQGIAHQKQGLTPADQQEREDTFPFQSLAKHFDNSVGFSETYNSNSRSWGFMRENQTERPEDEDQSKAVQLNSEEKPRISQIPH